MPIIYKTILVLIMALQAITNLGACVRRAPVERTSIEARPLEDVMPTPGEEVRIASLDWLIKRMGHDREKDIIIFIEDVIDCNDAVFRNLDQKYPMLESYKWSGKTEQRLEMDIRSGQAAIVLYADVKSIGKTTAVVQCGFNSSPRAAFTARVELAYREGKWVVIRSWNEVWA